MIDRDDRLEIGLDNYGNNIFIMDDARTGKVNIVGATINDYFLW